jgi:hypothetical protein
MHMITFLFICYMNAISNFDSKVHMDNVQRHVILGESTEKCWTSDGESDFNFRTRSTGNVSLFSWFSKNNGVAWQSVV